jgi:dipeptidyl aminopeptidase/acylaminoacyl peptidase
VSNQNTPGGGTTGFELFVRNGDGSGTSRRLTDTPNNVSSRAPAWSPAGDQIAYESNADGTYEIYTIDPGVTASFGTRRSANELGVHYQNPSWSPDAARIAFERGTGTMVDEPTKEIWTMRADGNDPVRAHEQRRLRRPAGLLARRHADRVRDARGRRPRGVRPARHGGRSGGERDEHGGRRDR